jgi:hypothetical protein
MYVCIFIYHYHQGTLQIGWGPLRLGLLGIYVYVHIHIYINRYAYACMNTNIYLYIYTYKYRYIYMYIFIYIFIYIYRYIFMYMYVYREMEVAVMRKGGASLSTLIRFLTSLLMDHNSPNTEPTHAPLVSATPSIPPVKGTPSIPPVKGVLKADSPPDLIHLLLQLISLISLLDIKDDNGVRVGHKTDMKEKGGLFNSADFKHLKIKNTSTQSLNNDETLQASIDSNIDITREALVEFMKVINISVFHVYHDYSLYF